MVSGPQGPANSNLEAIREIALTRLGSVSGHRGVSETERTGSGHAVTRRLYREGRAAGRTDLPSGSEPRMYWDFACFKVGNQVPPPAVGEL